MKNTHRAKEDLKPVTIGFRLEQKLNAVLAKQAGELGITVPELAKILVVQGMLQNESLAQVIEHLKGLGLEVNQVNEEIWICAESLNFLVNSWQPRFSDDEERPASQIYETEKRNFW